MRWQVGRSRVSVTTRAGSSCLTFPSSTVCPRAWCGRQSAARRPSGRLDSVRWRVHRRRDRPDEGQPTGTRTRDADGRWRGAEDLRAPVDGALTRARPPDRSRFWSRARPRPPAAQGGPPSARCVPRRTGRRCRSGSAQRRPRHESRARTPPRRARLGHPHATQAHAGECGPVPHHRVTATVFVPGLLADGAGRPDVGRRRAIRVRAGGLTTGTRLTCPHVAWTHYGAWRQLSWSAGHGLATAPSSLLSEEPRRAYVRKRSDH